ncbi:hypothetical protein FRB95_003549 [Tulasnella sp. JGI-2019a]|nr:hypothetical protein FRB95_003549 [Tulasnella sp. JGI-2019a]
MSLSNPLPALFTPLQLGDIKLQHRVVYAPLTRLRANDDHVHEEIAAEYYAQRTSPGGLLITEGTFISEEAGGVPNVPGIWNDDQISGWKRVTERVHAKGGFIYLQLWALGRTAYPAVLALKGLKCVSAGDIPTPPVVSGGELGPTPTPLTKEDIDRYVATYAQAAKNAVHKAGFDGIEIHGANGYLPDQFLQTNTNNRTDEFGGSIENRSRFPLMVLKAVTDAIGQEKTGIRLSPLSTFNGMRMEDDLLESQFTHLITIVRTLYPRFAYIHLTSPRVRGGSPYAEPKPGGGSLDFAREAWGDREGSPLITCGAFTRDLAIESVQEHGGAIAFGRAFLANPDLPLRLKYNVSLNEWDRTTFYSRGPKASKGLIDYPFSKELPEDARM